MSVRRWSKKGTARKSGSGRPPKYTEIETELMSIFRDSRSLGILMTNNSLLTEARRIADMLKKNDFTGTISWLEGVKKGTTFAIEKVLE